MIAQDKATGSGPINLTHIVPSGRWQQLVSVTLNLSAAPSTSENFTVTFDSYEGANYDTVLYSADLAGESATDVVWQPDAPFYLGPGDAIDVEWTNTDKRTYAVLLTTRGA